MLTTVLLAILYVLAGAMLLGFVMWLSVKPGFWQVIDREIGNLLADSNGSVFLGLCVLCALSWPFLLAFMVVVLPFIFFKWQYDNVWAASKKTLKRHDEIKEEWNEFTSNLPRHEEEENPTQAEE